MGDVDTLLFSDDVSSGSLRCGSDHCQKAPQVPLWALSKLSEVFSTPPMKQHVHIIVKKPPPTQSTGPEVNVEDNGDTLTDLKTFTKTSSLLPIINI